MDVFILTLDLLGTFVFAISGATLAVRHRMDLFGVLVLSAAAATAGGIMRDVLIGAIPPTALADWRYLAVSCLAGLLKFYRYAEMKRLRNPVQIFDGAGLALFAVLGSAKALDFGLAPFSAVLLGMLTGIGGGIVRDLLAAQVPVVLRVDLYAVAALLGAAVVVVGEMFDLPRAPGMVLGALLCFGLRYMAIRRGWRLPVASPPDG